MTELPLGKLIDANQKRDAVHVAVAPVVASERMFPGDRILFVEGSTEKVRLVCMEETGIGIVDPFLNQKVREGDRFFLWLYPGTITSLRHDWTHPAFEEAESLKSSSSKEWLEDFAEEVGVSYADLMASAKKWLDTGRYHTLGYDTPECVYQQAEDFWKNYEIVTGTKVEDRKATFFSCAC